MSSNTNPCKFVAEVSSNHQQDLKRCLAFVETAKRIGCDAVKFQLFQIDQLFAPEILQKSEKHQQRRQWELPLSFLPEISRCCKDNEIEFGCTPFYLKAVEELTPYVDFFKIASYELLWDDLLTACAKTRKPVVLSTGMATEPEILHACRTMKIYDCEPTFLHCVSAYPTVRDDCNLASINYLRKLTGCQAGWSDHSVDAGVLRRAVLFWKSSMIEFHLDIDGLGNEFETGHCWLPDGIEPVIQELKNGAVMDGEDMICVTPSEYNDRNWRADPLDGLRPLKHIRPGFSE